MKKLLLDTHALIWFLVGDTELSSTANNAILDTENIKFVSIASLWEIAIKVSIGKIQFDFEFKDFMSLLSVNGFEVLPIEFTHTLTVVTLPLYHRDPFDRMLIAQASVNDLIIVTRDPHFLDYEVSVLW